MRFPGFSKLSLFRLTTLLLLWVTPDVVRARQDAPAIDQLTDNVAAGLIARDLVEFSKEFSELCREAQIPFDGDILTNIFYGPLLDRDIDIDEAIHRRGSGGMILLGTEIEDSILRFVYPVQNSTMIAEAWGIDSMEFKAGSAYRTNSGDVVMLDGRMSVGVPFLWSARGPDQPEPVDNPFGNAESISKHLSETDHEMFGKTDAVIMLGNSLSTMFWEQVLQPMFGSPTEGNLEAWDRLEAAGKEVRFGLAALNMDQGVHLRSKSFFTNTTDGAAIQLIRDIRGGDEPSNLKYLPDAQVLVAGAARGNGEQNATLARAIVQLIVEVASPGEEVLTSDDKATFYEAFETIWRQLNGTRMALYRNEGEIGDGGELALVTIFDVEDPAALLESLPDLVKFANDGVQRTTPEGEEPDIGFQYQPEQHQMEGIEEPIDVLTIDTSRINQKNADSFKRFFGQQASQLRFVPLEKHVVMFLGSNPALLKSAIDNLKSGAAGLSESPAIVAANQKIDPRKKIELHFSARNFNYIYSAMIRKRKDLGRYVRPEEVTSLALIIEEDRFGFDFWVPIRELDRATKLLMGLDNF